jgi:hypothetical protein
LAQTTWARFVDPDQGKIECRTVALPNRPQTGVFIMVKPLSTQLADLSVRAKKAEEAVAAAQKEAHDKLVARREQAHADATAAIQKMDRDIKTANDKVVANWNALKAKVAADLDAWNAKIAQFKHDQGIKRAENHAERMEWEASFAIDFANAAIEEAKSAVLDAVVARIEAGKVKTA